MPQLSTFISPLSSPPAAWPYDPDSCRDGVHTDSTGAYCADDPVGLVDVDGRDWGLL